MFSLKNNPHRIVLLAVGALTLVLGVLAFIVPQSLFPDPSWGFQVMRYMEHSHTFNLLPNADPENIATDYTDFLSWWSPGQYLLPYCLKTILWLNTGKAVALTVTLCSALGLSGYYMLFKKLGFSRWLAAISIAFIACQNYFILPFIYYPGGEVLLFAFGGWFLYGCFSIQKINWQAMVFLFVAGLTGFFSKSSVLWMYAAGTACIWIRLSSPQKNIRQWLINGILLGIPVLCALVTIYVFYLSKGANPSSTSGAWLLKPETITFPLASPLLSGLSLDEAFNGLIYHPDAAVLSYKWSIVIIILLTLGSLFFVNRVIKKIPHKNYALVLTVFYIAATLFFSVLYLKQANISFEGRHYRVIGMLSIPGLVYLLTRNKAGKIVLSAVWLAAFCWGMAYFSIEYNVNIHAGHGPSGLTQQSYDQATLDELHRLDASHPNGGALFVTISPELAIELKNRVFTLDVDDISPKQINQLKYAGKAGSIYMLMPSAYQNNGIAAKLSKSFINYHHFKVQPLGDDHYLYSADN